MQLRLTDGTTTIDLSGGTTGIKGVTYFPAPGEGGDSVSETIEIVGSGTAAQIRAAANAVERLLEIARMRRKLGVGVKVFLEYKPVTTDELWRSEVYDGRFTWSDDPVRANCVGAIHKHAWRCWWNVRRGGKGPKSKCSSPPAGRRRR